jgi:probable F420-dependent oxidoreductase
VKLGIHLPLEFFSPSQAIKAARAVEVMGLDHVLVNDHFRLPGGSYIGEAWTTLAAIGAVTTRIRIGPCVTPLPLRHPYLLAKMAATVDQLSQGRLLMGVGAGWHKEEFDWLGVTFLPHSKRVNQTQEAIQIIQALWTESHTTFGGHYYQVDDITVEPKPVQTPHPPFFFGGGSLGVLELIARYGQGWMPFAPTPEGLTRRLKQLSEILKVNNRSLNELEIIPSVLFQLGESKKAALQRLPKWGKPPTQSRVILGSPEDCLKGIKKYKEAGATHLSLRLLHPDEVENDLKMIVREISVKL